MNIPDVIGSVVALFLKDELADDRTADGTARYIIDCLSAEHTAAIARQILGDPSLIGQIELKLPAGFMSGQGLPEEVLTTFPATYHRNASCSKPVLLVANTGDEEEQSLKEFTRIGTPELLADTSLWVRVAGVGLNLSEAHAKWWEKALVGLRDIRVTSLNRFAAYVVRTRDAVFLEGHPILRALGASLPALRFPRDLVFSNRVREGARGHASAWKAQFGFVAQKRACYLLKKTPAQLLLDEDDLAAAFEKAHDSIPGNHHAIVQAFIKAPSGWNDAAVALAECEWEDIKALFDGVKREKYNLGKETAAFFDDREPGLLTDEEQEYLQRLVTRSTTEPTEEDAAFYEAHRNEVKEDRKLKSAWDRFIFGKARETEDFLAGVATSMEALFNRGEPGSRRRLKIRCDRATKKDLKELNYHAGLHFACRYKGVKTLFGDHVTWDVGQLFDFPALVETWRSARRGELNRSEAKLALQLKFVLELEVDLVDGSSQSYTAQLVWKFNPNTVVSQFYEDFCRLRENPLIFSTAIRETISTKGQFQSIDLSNVRTLLPAYDRDRGSFVAVYKKAHDITHTLRANLREARNQQLLSEAIAEELESRCRTFEVAYGEAIAGFLDDGLAHPALLTQLSAFADLLHAISLHAKGDRNRELLLRPLLRIGTVLVEGGPSTAIVAPWHPLRLAAIHQKAQLVADLVRHLLEAEEVYFGDTRLFFKDLAQELAHAFYPEVVLGWQGNRAELLSLSDTVQDYSLHEAPVLERESNDDTNENPTEGSNCVLGLVERYLNLHPHEQTNMSVVLYNCDSARLPEAVVDKLGQLYENEEDVRCQVLLRHSDPARLRDLYKTIVSTSDVDADAFNASEATQDFMARLRICIIADQAPPPDPKDGCPYDILFSQDVIARHAQVEWYPERATPVELEALVPARWSRRRPAAMDDMKSVVYLCCPVQSREGWAFLTALTTFLKGDWDGQEARRLLPARQLDFRDNRTAVIFEETHNLGNWVVNYDELLDRRQLLNQNVRVIRYKQSATQGRNLVISSKASLGLLRSMVLTRIRDLNLGLSEDDYRSLAERFIQDASDISGDIVLRAAKRGRNASELMGIVLSRYLLRHEIGLDRYHGWYFLDDYAEWLGQREEQIADVLALSPEQTADGGLQLAVYLAEAKYIDSASVASKRRESQKQVRDTMKRINEAVFGAPERLDRNLWLARLSDLILDGVKFPASAGINLSDWRRAIREGACEISVRGYSHVFVSDPTEAAECSSFYRDAELEEAFQEVYGRTELRELVLSFFRNESPLPVRLKVVGENIWETRSYRLPTNRATVGAPRKQRRSGRGQSAPDGQQGPAPAGDSAPPTPEPAPDSGGSAAAAESQQPSAEQGQHPGWAYPAIGELLRVQETTQGDEQDLEWLRQTETRTKHALQQFQLQAKLLTSILTPNCALIRFSGSANLTVEQVSRRRSEFLTTHGLNLIAVRPEPGVVTLAIERPHRRVIKTPEIWNRWRAESGWGNQSVLLGVREDDGNLLLLCPGREHAPHTLIAGSTGSGKSVLMQNIILGLVATNTPLQVRIVLIDPKQGVDYFPFEGLPHLEGDLIVDPGQASTRLHELVSEMDERYVRFRTARAQNLISYNQKVPVDERMPAVWLIHDEFAEWMMVEDYKQAVTTAVARLGVKARAAGIHLVFAAQRPDANVMPMQLRANLGNRLILKVDSAGTSEIALGEEGAEYLLGHGHLVARLDGVQGLLYGQVPFAEQEFVDRVVASIRLEHDSHAAAAPGAREPRS